YPQVRVGLRGERFTMLKFRTMRLDAEEGLGPMWSLKDDPRCTKLGAWLRRRGIDELPQLWNILCGEMSVVGPRPERPEFVKEFSASYPAYAARDAVRSGLTRKSTAGAAPAVWKIACATTFTTSGTG